MLRPIALREARALVERFHGYGACGNTATYCIGGWVHRACTRGEEGAWLARTFDDVDAGHLWKNGKPARKLVRRVA
jgi:hypothetical protein